jgi:phospholipid N-methyltransferase
MIDSGNGEERTGAASTFSQQSPLRFLEAFLRNPFAVGSLWPSSRSLARAIVDSCEFQPDDIVVELGPGTGAFTGLLLQRLSNRGRLIAMEISETNIDVLRRRFPRCRTIHDSAENLPRHLSGKKAECIISGLAWANMLPVVQDRIFDGIFKSLAPGGEFVAFAYAHAYWMPTSARFRRQLIQNFQHVETSPIIWRNLPPAFVFRCWREFD